MYAIGPHQFTQTDAKRTVMFADEIFDLYAQGRNAEVIEHLRPPRPTGELEADLAAVWSSWTSAGPAMRAPVGSFTRSNTGAVCQPPRTNSLRSVLWRMLR